jgi:hypothetical protein
MHKLMAGDTGRRRYDAPSGVPAASVGHGPWSKRPATRVVLEARLRNGKGKAEPLVRILAADLWRYDALPEVKEFGARESRSFEWRVRGIVASVR